MLKQCEGCTKYVEKCTAYAEPAKLVWIRHDKPCPLNPPKDEKKVSGKVRVGQQKSKRMGG